MTNERLIVPRVLDGARLDTTVALATGLSRGSVRSLLARGGVVVNGVTVTRGSRRVQVDQAVIVELDLALETSRAAVTADPTVPFELVYCDEDLLVVDKPAGVVVHPGAANREGTLVHGLLARFPELALQIEQGADPERPGIVHRLDKDTSGLLVVGRTFSATTALSAQLGRREIGRRYRAVVLGTIEEETGVIDAPIGRSERDRTAMAVRYGGRSARTRYEVRSRRYEPAPVTELELDLETGRTHQIRVHLAAIGHPVLGDGSYGGRRGRYANGDVPLPHRPYLHAVRLQLTHPRTLERLEWHSPVPVELLEVLEHYR